MGVRRRRRARERRVAAVHRAHDPDSVPVLRPLDDSGFRAVPPAIGTVGLLVATVFTPEEYRVIPIALGALAVCCFTGRAFVIQRENRLAHGRLKELPNIFIYTLMALGVYFIGYFWIHGRL